MHVFWGMKKLVQLKFVQLLLLNRVKGKVIKKPCFSRFLLHKFVQLKYFWTQFKKRAPARSVQLEAVYLEALL